MVNESQGIDRYFALAKASKWKLGAAGGGVIVLPMIVGPLLSGQIILLCVFALGYNLLFGYAGEISFGHAAFFGVGAYATALSMEHLVANILLAVLIATVAAGVIAAIFGRVSLVRRGVTFAMITLALAQMLHTLSFTFGDVTGGSNGIFVRQPDPIMGTFAPTGGGMHFYVLAIILLILTVIGIYRLIHSPFGKTLAAVRENEQRAAHIGYDTTQVLLIAFVISGLVAGLAGALHALLFLFITPSVLFWALSGQIILIVIMGGPQTLEGPIVGVLTFILFSEYLRELTSHWPLFFGGLFVLIVLFAPNGIYGLYRSGKERVGGRF
jgi:branched-chain amino acid transport system permease protein